MEYFDGDGTKEARVDGIQCLTLPVFMENLLHARCSGGVWYMAQNRMEEPSSLPLRTYIIYLV